jgi:hypothetical protein
MPQYADALSSLMQGQQFVDGLFTQRARREAGGLLARGDNTGAANTFYRSGDIAGGTALQDRAIQQQNAQRTQQEADRGKQLQTTLQVARVLKATRDAGGDVVAELDGYLPTFAAMGTDPGQLQQIRSQIAANPAFLDQIEQIAGQQLAEWEFRDGGAGDVVAVRVGANGLPESRVAYDAPDRPIATQFGIILPPNARPAGSTVSAAAPSGAVPAMTGPSIANTPLWSRQEQQESGGRQSAVSPVGAFGVAQLMPETAADLARQMGVTPSQLRSDENLNRQAGQMYMDQQLQKYGGNEVLALAAYNAGPGRVDEWIDRFGDPRTGEITTEEFAAAIPFAETRNYVRNITQGNYGGSQPVAQGSDQGQDLQDLGGGYTLQPMVTPAEQRQAQAEERRAALDARRDAREEGRYQRETSGALTPAQQASQSAQTFTQERQLRTEFGNNPAVRTLATVRPQVQIIGDIARRASAGERISAADDLALIFSYMKMLDPGSVVREGEFANAQNTAGIPERVVNAYNRALDGTRLSDSQRNEFFRSATGVMRGYQESYNEVVTRQRGLAESYGLNADRIAPATPTRSQQQTTPRLRFTPTTAQTQASQSIVASRGNAQARRGERLNPILINPADPSTSFGNVPRGAYFITPDGQVRGPKP